MEFDGIPQELKDLPQWVCWERVPNKKNPDKMDKVPKRANSVYGADTTDPEHWADFADTRDYYLDDHYHGIGFVFSKDDPYCGIDLDKCRDSDTGQIQPWAIAIIESLNSYTEISQSGTGIHILVKAKLSEKGRKRCLPGTDHEVEIYDRARFFATTGDRLDDYPEDVQERQTVVSELYDSLPPKANDNAGSKPTDTQQIRQVSPVISDEEVKKRASEAGNGAKFQQLMAGDSSDYPSESEADGGLAALIGFWTQDFDQILRIIQQSGLWDEKWEREDYQQSTINGAVARLNTFWRQVSNAQPKAATEAQIEPTEPEVMALPPSKFDMEALRPPAGFLGDYLDFQEPLSEAPGHLHIFAGLILLSSAIGKKVYYSVGMDRKHTNLWIVINGPSGCKKTTVINAAGKVFNEAGFKDNRLPTQFTSEIMIEMLSKKPEGTFFWGEWGATMDQWGKSYASDIMSILTDLYDGGYFSRWLRSEKMEINGACLNMLCGSTPDWLKTVLDAKRAAMGFWPRFLFVPVGDPACYLPIPPTPDADRLNELSGRLRGISESIPDEFPQEVDFDLVSGRYSQYYIESKEKAQKSGDSLQQAFTTRLLDYVKKIAILVELSKPDREDVAVQVSMESMEYAIKLVDWLEGTARFTITAATRSAMSELEERLLEFIKSKGAEGVLRRGITQRFQREDNREVTWALENLENAEVVDMTETTPKKGKPGKRYYAIS